MVFHMHAWSIRQRLPQWKLKLSKAFSKSTKFYGELSLPFRAMLDDVSYLVYAPSTIQKARFFIPQLLIYFILLHHLAAG